MEIFGISFKVAKRHFRDAKIVAQEEGEYSFPISP
jgi:hypothetical protein